MDITTARGIAQRLLDERRQQEQGLDLVIVDEAITPWEDCGGWGFPLHSASTLSERRWTLAIEAPSLILVNGEDAFWLE